MGFSKKHPHPHANHLRVRTQTRTWSWVKNLNSKKAPGQYRPRTRRPRRVCRPPCAPYPVLPTLHHYPSGVKNYEGQRRAAPRRGSLPCTYPAPVTLNVLVRPLWRPLRCGPGLVRFLGGSSFYLLYPYGRRAVRRTSTQYYIPLYLTF